MADHRPVVYLAGPIRCADDPVGWRAAIRQSTTEYAIHDPMRRDVDPRDDPAEEIVKGDLQMIDDSDAVFVGYRDDVPSVGTAMEIRYASETDTPVVVWQRDDSETIASPWLEYHADIIRDQRDAALWQLHGMVSGAGPR